MNTEIMGTEKEELLAMLPYMTEAERKAVAYQLAGPELMGVFPLIPIIKGLVTAIPSGIKKIVERVKARKAAKKQAAAEAQAATVQAAAVSSGGFGKIPPAALIGVAAVIVGGGLFLIMKKKGGRK